MGSLMGHIVYGIVLGLGYAALPIPSADPVSDVEPTTLEHRG